MFDLRYHVASLAAVFVALIIGILVGVGISDRGLVDRGTGFSSRSGSPISRTSSARLRSARAS